MTGVELDSIFEECLLLVVGHPLHQVLELGAEPEVGQADVDDDVAAD